MRGGSGTYLKQAVAHHRTVITDLGGVGKTRLAAQVEELWIGGQRQSEAIIFAAFTGSAVDECAGRHLQTCRERERVGNWSHGWGRNPLTFDDNVGTNRDLERYVFVSDY